MPVSCLLTIGPTLPRSGIYAAIDLSQWIAGNPVDVLATNFAKPAGPFEKFPHDDVFIAE
ncbi:MAG TPA: hypothetical protein VGX78_22265 [Pirellulales bacterium]|jgi:oxalate decarboxylase|nr:hypothetical protein [Pirellulales bacterium]